MEEKNKQEVNNFLLDLKDNLLIIKDLLNKKLEQQYDLLNNKDGKLEILIKMASSNILINQLKMSENDEKIIEEKLEEINKLTKELKAKIE